MFRHFFADLEQGEPLDFDLPARVPSADKEQLVALGKILLNNISTSMEREMHTPSSHNGQ